jgi:Fe-S-cluster-containing dehydrogenase component
MPGVSRRELLKAMGVGAGLLFVPIGPVPTARGDGDGKAPDYDWEKHYWGYAVDTTKCIGCCACMRACRAENDVPEGFFRTWIERYTIDAKGEVRVDTVRDENVGFEPLPESGGQAGEGDIARSFFVPKICNHCEKSVCNQVCPVGAAYRTRDGLVLVDQKRCIGCGYCVQACPYGSRFINPRTHTADKCTLCYHRISKGQLPACVQACPKGARIFGDLNDKKSEISILLRQRRYRLLKPEMGTHPKCYYIGLDREVI